MVKQLYFIPDDGKLRIENKVLKISFLAESSSYPNSKVSSSHN